MFFIFSKIMWLLLAPANFILILFLLSGLIWFFNKKLSRVAFLSAGTLFVLIGIFPIGHNLLVYLEKNYEQSFLEDKAFEGILVLGGYFSPDIYNAKKIPSLNSNGDRVVEALRLIQQFPHAKIIFSGKVGSLRKYSVSETEITKEFLRPFDIKADQIIFESNSRNTYENIKFSYELLKPEPEEEWLLLTSAYHMNRAMRVAKSYNWKLIPHPVDYRTNGKYKIFPYALKVSHSFYQFEIALKELVGLIFYRFSGKILE
jgi:uncharacterized SAM-binding protein YcdF (DUF218 family)